MLLRDELYPREAAVSSLTFGLAAKIERAVPVQAETDRAQRFPLLCECLEPKTRSNL